LETFQNGTNAETYLFQGVINSATVKIQIVPLGRSQFEISAYAKQVDVSGWADPVTVGIGDNSDSASVTPVPAELRGNWRNV